MIKTNSLHIGYSEALLSVKDFELGSGLHILIGKNGSGKSTFLKTLSGQIKPKSGQVYLQGNDVSAIEERSIPKLISFVSPQFPHVEFMRVIDFIQLSRSPYTNFFGTTSQKDKELALEALDLMGIEQLKYRFTSELSDGEKQLVAIAKAICQETSIITLDEPTAFLDYTNKKRVLDNLIKLASEFDKCIIMSSHDLDMSLDAQCPFLLVHDERKEIQLHQVGVTKEELIGMAF